MSGEMSGEWSKVAGFRLIPDLLCYEDYAE